MGSFENSGFLGPITLLDQSEVAQITCAIKDVIADHPEFGPLSKFSERTGTSRENYFSRIGQKFRWFKSLHDVCKPVAALAANPLILERVKEILNHHSVSLWGAAAVIREPNAKHRWHVDVEARCWKSINVWIALENVTPDCSLQVIQSSHKLDTSPQELAQSQGLNLNSSADVLRAAQSMNMDAKTMTFAVHPGQFYLFDGNLWHGSANQTSKTRLALLLQYSHPDADIRIPRTFSIPPKWHDLKPPSLVLE